MNSPELAALLRFSPFLLFVSIVLALGLRFLYRRWIESTALKPATKRVFLVMASAFWLLQLLGPAIYRVQPSVDGDPAHWPFWLEPLAWITYLSLGAFAFLMIATIMVDIPIQLWRKVSLKFGQKLNLKPSRLSDSMSRDRRAWLTTASRTGLMTLTGAAYLKGLDEALSDRAPQIERVEVPIRDLPRALEGLTMAQVSDLHVGPTIGRQYAEKVRGVLETLKPELICLTGDMVDGTVEQLKDRLEPMTRLWAPLGVYFCTGNHEYFWNVEEWTQFWESRGVKTLENRHVVIERENEGTRGNFVLAGVRDAMSERFHDAHKMDVAEAFQGAPQSALRILLAHQPKACFLAESHSVHLQLSGHTHAGQFFPGNLFVCLQQPYVKGLNAHKENWVYVNRGTGYWGPPLRLGAAPEVTLLTLRRALI